MKCVNGGSVEVVEIEGQYGFNYMKTCHRIITDYGSAGTFEDFVRSLLIISRCARAESHPTTCSKNSRIRTRAFAATSTRPSTTHANAEDLP